MQQFAIGKPCDGECHKNIDGICYSCPKCGAHYCYTCACYTRWKCPQCGNELV